MKNFFAEILSYVVAALVIAGAFIFLFAFTGNL